MYIITLIILYVIYECDEVNQQIITWKLDGYSKIEILKKWLRIFFEALILKLYGLIRTKIVTEINPIFCNCSLKQTRGLLTNIRNVVPLNKSENTIDSNFPAVTFSAE